MEPASFTERPGSGTPGAWRTTARWSADRALPGAGGLGCSIGIVTNNMIVFPVNAARKAKYSALCPMDGTLEIGIGHSDSANS
jgi:hypothetical protein